jgi:deoxyribodipyrimidine photo-lyase
VTNVVWFRRDLRLADHGVLAAAAAAAEPIVPLFVIDPAIWSTAGPRRRSRLTVSLQSLDEGIRDLGGSGLVVRSGDPRVEVPALAAAVGANSVLHTAESTPYGKARDAVVGEELTAAGIGFEPADTPFLHAPGEILTGSGAGYSVFTPYYRSWSARPTPAPIDVPSLDFLADVASDGVPEPEMAVVGGEGLAQAELSAFVADRISSYGSQRNRPDLAATSRLGAALHFGEIHPRTVVAAAGSSGEAFVRQLCWRDFYADVLYRLPQARDENVDQRFDVVPWQQGPAADEMFELWAAGKTGYPFVDAGMRQLVKTGWMHNRVRMVVASFLTKDLIIDWRRGARFFLQHLEDGDVANNALGWQWTAGTGTDAAPYFRVFNPVLQGLKFDPDGDYVRKFVPELAHLPGTAVHEPWRHSDGYAHGYSERIVDHKEAREEALRIYEAVKGSPAAK